MNASSVVVIGRSQRHRTDGDSSHSTPRLTEVDGVAEAEACTGAVVVRDDGEQLDEFELWLGVGGHEHVQFEALGQGAAGRGAESDERWR